MQAQILWIQATSMIHIPLPMLTMLPMDCLAQLLENFEQYVSGGKSIEDVTGITYNPLNKRSLGQMRAEPRHVLLKLQQHWDGTSYVAKTSSLVLIFALQHQQATGLHGNYLFEPIVGNGHHWELGGGMNMWWTWWRSCDEDRTLRCT